MHASEGPSLRPNLGVVKPHPMAAIKKKERRSGACPRDEHDRAGKLVKLLGRHALGVLPRHRFDPGAHLGMPHDFTRDHGGAPIKGGVD